MTNRKLKNGQKSICGQNYKRNTSYITLSNVYSIIKLENLVLMISNNGLAANFHHLVGFNLTLARLTAALMSQKFTIHLKTLVYLIEFLNIINRQRHVQYRNVNTTIMYKIR